MANIQNELNNIKNAVYGKDVRDSIHDAIKTCYDDASIVNNNANMEVKMARGVHSTLRDRLNKSDEKQKEISSQLEHKANTIDVNSKIWSMSNMGQDVKEAMTGGSVAVVGKDTVLTENIVDNQVTPSKTSFFENTSLIKDKSFADNGAWINGSVEYFEDWCYINETITIKPNTKYYVLGATDYHFDILDSENTITRHIAGNIGMVFVTSNNEVGLKVSFLKKEKENVGISIYKNHFQLNDSNLDRFINVISKFNNENAFLNNEGEISFTDDSITFKELRFFSIDGVFYQLKDTIATIDNVGGQFDCIIINLTNNFAGESEFGHCYEMTLEKGSSKTVWQNVQFLNKNQRVLCFKNDGKWISMYGEINRVFNKIYEDINNQQREIITVEKIVRKNGAIGVNCDYTDIKQALDSITDNGYYKRYKIKVFDGVYDYSNNGENIGIKLKNYVEVEGVNKSTTIIKKLEDTFDWGKATVDMNNEKVEYTKIKGFTLISNNCKCPLHIDGRDLVGTFIGEDLDLINLQAKGTGDFPVDGSPNCGAFGLATTEHIILKNVRANGKLWGHNWMDTNSNATLEFINCNSKKLQFGDLTSQGNDKIILKGCRADVLEHLWFSEYESSKGRKPSYEFTLEGNNINKTIVDDHAKMHDALNEYFKGKYPFNLAEIHTYCYCTEDVEINDLVYEKDFTNLFEVTKTNNGKLVGRVIENKTNNMVLVEKVNN